MQGTNEKGNNGDTCESYKSLKIEAPSNCNFAHISVNFHVTITPWAG